MIVDIRHDTDKTNIDVRLINFHASRLRAQHLNNIYKVYEGCKYFCQIVLLCVQVLEFSLHPTVSRMD